MSLRVGLIARCEDRGISNQSWEFHRHLHPAKTLMIDVGPLTRGFAMFPERYPGDVTTVEFDGVALPEAKVRRWLHGLDVVYSVETLYDWRLADWARQAGVKTVVHLNPEFYKHTRENGWSHPDAWWVPTTWRLDKVPASARLVPVPVAVDRFAPRERTDSRFTFLHVIGHAALGDRAGTIPLMRALRMCRAPMRVRIVTQDAHVKAPNGVRPNIDVEMVTRSAGDYWRLYDNADVLVQPRRYGGLSLVLNEAAAAGLALIMPDTAPHPETWPGRFVKATARSPLAIAAGHITMNEVDSPLLAVAMDEMAEDPGLASRLGALARAWAEEHSWERLAPLYRAELARVADPKAAHV